MRLINAKTLKLEEFYDVETRPEYAILSHRWVPGEEVSFQDMQRDDRQKGADWSKIQFCCQQALEDGYEYAWVDTCCIDKTSSAELSEAINSMFDWYSGARVCYAYLMDVDTTGCLSHEGFVSEILRSTWFTRAWTLQELIAPLWVVFFDKHFRRMFTKTDIAEHVERYTKVPVQVLREPAYASTYPVAVRMSWAASRKASRLEDIAYSLFGLFEVNLPLLYGEGKRAFVRLQEEIIRRTHDHSIFVWSPGKGGTTSLFAVSPTDFKHSGDISPVPQAIPATPYAMTNMGLSIELQISPFVLDTHVALLSCHSSATGHRYAIFLVLVDYKGLRWHRVTVNGMGMTTLPDPESTNSSSCSSTNASMRYRFREQKIYIVNPSPTSAYSVSRLHGVVVDAPSFLTYNRGARRPYTLLAYHDWNEPNVVIPGSEDGGGQVGSQHPWGFNGTQGVFGTPRTLQLIKGMVGMVLFDELVHGVRAIKLVFDLDFRLVVILATHKATLDPDVTRQFQGRSYCSVEEYRRRMLGSSPVSAFWTEGLNGLDTTRYENIGGSFAIEEGVHGFVAAEDLVSRPRWVYFKPYENEPWHIDLAFVKRSSMSQMCWEFTMDVRRDPDILRQVWTPDH